MVVVDVVDDVDAPVLVVSSSGSGTGGHDGIRPIAASVLTEATNVSGAAGSGRASHGSSVATRILNSAGGGPVTVAVKSKKQFHCRPPPETSSQRLRLDGAAADLLVELGVQDQHACPGGQSERRSAL